MKIIMKHIFVFVIYSVILSAVLLGVTFLVFPLDDWTMLYKQRLWDVSFPLILLMTILCFGLFIGIITGIYWKGRIQLVEKQLDELIREQKVSPGAVYKELDLISERFRQLEELFRLQSEQAQKLATKRSEEREKSLQEVVIQERNRLARELHDSVSQQLFAASMMMSALNETEHIEVVVRDKQLRMIEHTIHQSQLEMRALLLHLRPVPLKGKSLQAGVEELLAEMESKVPLEIDWKIEDFTIDKGIEDQLFRILQEAVSNTLRHANAKHLNVLLIERDETIILRITDDGDGFDMDEVKTGSYGLENMQERAFEAGGTCKIISLVNEGTRLEVKVPQLKKVVERDD